MERAGAKVLDSTFIEVDIDNQMTIANILLHKLEIKSGCLNVSIAQIAICYFYRVCHSPLNDIIVNIVYHDIDLITKGQN